MVTKKVTKIVRGYTRSDGTKVKGHRKTIEKKMASNGSKKSTTKYKYTRPKKKTKFKNKFRNQSGQLTKSANGKTIYRKSMVADKRYRAKSVGKRTTTNPHRHRGKIVRKSTTYYENRANRSDGKFDKGGTRQSWHYRK